MNERIPSFSNCAPDLWIGHLETLEINVPGNGSEPDSNAIRFLSQIIDQIAGLQERARVILREFIKFPLEWAVDAVKLLKKSDDAVVFDVCVELSNEEDVYGLWKVRFQRLGGEFVFSELSRLQE